MATHADHPNRGSHPEHEWYLGRLFLAAVLLGFGVIALLDAAGTLNGDRAVNHWWPVILILAGALRIAEGGRSRVVSLVLIGVGAALLLFTTDAVSGDPGQYVGPAVLIVIALVVLSHAHVRPLPGSRGDTAGALRVDGILSRPEAASSSEAFGGAYLTAFLGHATLDLRQAQPRPEGADVTATAMLGGIDVLVPEGWRIEISGTPILGSVHDKTDRAQAPVADAPVLRVDALAVLGGVDVKHKRD